MKLAISIILGFFAVRGFRFKLEYKELVYRNTESFIWLLAFLFFSYVFYLSIKRKDRRLIGCSAIFGGVIGTFYIIGDSMERMTNLSWALQSSGKLLNFLNLFFSFGCLYYSAAYILFMLLSKYGTEHPRGILKKIKVRHVLIVWVILMVCYIPWYLYFYPGVLTEDSGAQIHDAITLNSLSDHNPAFVTLLIRAIIVPVRNITGSIQTAVGVCTFLQMTVMTFIFALSFVYICKYIQNKILRVLIFIWFAAWPVNNIYSFTMWKDILFSGCLLIFSLYLDHLSEDEDAFFNNKKNCIGLLITMLLLPLLRHNGIFVTAGMTVYLVIHNKKYRKTTIMICCGSLVFFGLWKLVLLPALGVRKNPSSELLAVPLQQIAGTLYYHHHDVSPWLLEEIQEYFTEPELWNEYNEHIADPIKQIFLLDKYDEDPEKFFTLWKRLGEKYPIEYLEAFINNNYGYYYPETSWWITGRGVRLNIKISGLRQAPIIRLKIIDKIYNWYINSHYKKTPIIPLLFKPGACWWLWVFCGCYCLYRNKRKFVMFLPGLLIWIPLQFSAVYCEFRYFYGLFVCAPLLLTASLTPPLTQNKRLSETVDQ